MNNDLIKRFDAIEALGEEPYVWTDDDEFAQGERSQWISDVSAIRAVPSADRPQGEWMSEGRVYPPTNAYHSAYCSHCGEWSEYLTDYCGNCGADMRGKDDEASD